MDGLLLSPLRSIYHPLFPARLVCLLGTCTEYLTLINTLKMLSPLAAGKSFLPVMPLTRCPIYTLIWLSSVHANKKKIKKIQCQSVRLRKKDSVLVLTENSCLLPINQVKTVMDG